MKDNDTIYFIAIDDNPATSHRRIRFVIAIPGKFNARLPSNCPMGHAASELRQRGRRVL
jgi:hypothetical protein